MVVGPLAQETQVAKLEGWDQTTVPQTPIGASRVATVAKERLEL